MHAATGDPACRAKLDDLVAEWGRCIEPDGWFFASRKPNAPHYIYEKTVCGLVDAYLYGGNREALALLAKITDWADKNLDRKIQYAFNSGGGPTEWYTLSENLYRAYLATGDERYRTFGKVWEYTEYWKHYADKADIFTSDPRADQYHAYSHVNALSGAGAAYRVTGEKHYLDTLVNAYDYLQANQVYATGGYGPNEQLFPPDQVVLRLTDTCNHFETQCGSWAAFKMCKYLMSFTGDARYGDWVERLVINGIGASVPMSAEGDVFYYADYNLGGGTKHANLRWSCCTGTRPQAVADYHDLVYFRDAAGLFVNLYAAADVAWKHGGEEVTVRQRTRFPEADATEFEIAAAKPVKLALRLRVPGWLASPMTAKLNGLPVELKTDVRHWAAIERTWNGGDRLEVALPAKFWTSRPASATSKSPFPVAILRGPVVLACRSPGANPSKKVDFANLEKQFVPAAGEPLTYHLAADPAVLVRPFYAYKERETYFVYLDPATSVLRVLHPQLQYSAGWQDLGHIHVTTTVGATVEHAFRGTGVRWHGWRYDDAGKAEVSIDGKVVEVVDQFIPARGVPFTWSRDNLPAGEHTIRIKLLEEKTEGSKNRYINIAWFEVKD